MKKIYLLSTFIFISFTTSAQIVNIPDTALKNYLLQYEPAIDTNYDNQIQVSEALAVTSLYINNYDGYIGNLSGLESFTNLISLGMSYINGAGFNPSTLTRLQNLYCNDVNDLGVLDLSGLVTLRDINVRHCQITSLNLSGLTNLSSLNCSENPITALNLSGLSSLQTLDCNSTFLTSLSLSGLTNLTTVNCSYNTFLTSLITTGANNITNLNCSGCTLTSLTVSNMTHLQNLNCSYQQYASASGISSLDLTGLTSLISLDCNSNNLTSLNVADLTNLTSLQCSYNHITSLDVTPLLNLTTLSCGRNPITTLNVTPLTHLIGLECSWTSISAIDVSTLTNLDYLYVNNNAISTLNLSNNTALTELYCGSNQLTVLPISNLVHLRYLDCSSNQLTTLDLSNLILLQHLNCSSNQLTTLDLSNLNGLQEIRVGGNLLTSMDFTHNPAVGALGISVADSPNLTYINVKNGTPGQMGAYQLIITNCPNLENICTNEDDIAYILGQIASGSYMGTTPSNVQVNSYCSFVPGGVNNTIIGTVTLDINRNGCDANDVHPQDFKINLNDGINTGATFSSATGNYLFYTQTGNFTLTPQFSNPYFTITPATSTVTFANLDGSAQTQNYCIRPNGIHNDLEITLIPIDNARPGFDSVYILIYKNKGTEVLSGTIDLSFNDAVLDFVSATPTINSQTLNQLNWNYTNLQPFESRTIYFTMNLNSPVESPAVNIDDILRFTANISPFSGDETSEDNSFQLTQIVRGSYDPNDKTCLEGSTITPDMVGDYLHYVIRFQNSGSYYAENVVVKDVIDTSKFDINSLELTASSHPNTTRINGNKVEFLFENINLPAEIDNEPASHGFVAFKIKTKSNLVLGNQIQNTADIYFDFNAPVVTNTTSTTVSLLNVSETEVNGVSISPIPVKDVLQINALNTINSVQLYDIQGRLLQTKTIESLTTSLDFTGKTTGIYLVKVYTSKGMKIQKVIKE